MTALQMNGRHRPAQTELVVRSAQAYARRAAVRRRLRHANTDVRTLLTQHLATNPDLGALRVRSALRELPGFGRTRVDALLDDLGIDGEARLRHLRMEQIRALTDRLDAR